MMESRNNYSPEESFVLQFVNSLRVHIECPDVSESYVKQIELLFKKVLSYVVTTSEHDPISMIICQSCTKYSQIVPIQTRQERMHYYLVFDKHLSNINRLISSLYYSNEDPEHDIWKLSYELFTEEAIVAGEELFATYFGLNKIALGPFNIENEEPGYDSDFVGLIQDLYILGHEVGHFFYDLYTDDRTSDTLNISTMLDKMAVKVKAMLDDIYDYYKIRFKDKEYNVLIAEQEDVIQNKSRIIDECLADALSYAIIFAIVDEEYPNDSGKKIQATQAIFLELMNLQLLAMHHMTVSEESFENSTSIRLSFFRNYAAAYFEDDPASFSKILQETVVRYEERITNRMLECFSVFERRSDYLFDTITNPDGTLEFQEIIGLS